MEKVECSIKDGKIFLRLSGRKTWCGIFCNLCMLRQVNNIANIMDKKVQETSASPLVEGFSYCKKNPLSVCGFPLDDLR